MVDFNDLKHEWLKATGRYVEDWYLGDSSGQIYDIDGLVFVHQRNASGQVVREKSVRGPTQGAVPMDKWGIAVLVGLDHEGKEALVGISFSGALQQGIPPGLANPGDLNAYGDVISQDIIHLKVTPTDPPSLSLAVQEHYYIMGRAFYHIAQDQIDVSGFIPAGPNEQCLIGVNAKRDGTFEAFASTAQDTLDPLDDSDVQELLDQFTPGGIAAYAYWVNDSTTAITDANIFQDLRPLWRPDFRDVMSVSPAGTLTISSGAVTTNRSYHHISAQAGSSDDLDTITEVEDRQLLILQATSGHTITVKHDVGNIMLNGEADVILSGSKTLILFYDGTNWSDTAFGSGGGYGDSYWYGYADSGDAQLIEPGDTFTISGDGTTTETETQEKGVVVGVKDGGIDTQQLADDAVTKAKLDPEVYAEPDAIGTTTPAAGTFTEVNVHESGHLFHVNTGVSERFTVARNAKWDGAVFRRSIADNHANAIQFTPDGEIDFLYATDAFDTVGSVVTFDTAMRVDANGNVGIGTTSPDAKLTLQAPTDGVQTMGTWKNNDGNTRFQFLYDVNNILYHIADRSGNPLLSIKEQGGNVAIGTTTPGLQTSAGRRYLTIAGSTSIGVVELTTGESDGDDVALGHYVFADSNASGDKRAAMIAGVLEGATGNNRGGKIQFATKSNNGSLIVRSELSNIGTQVWFNPGSSPDGSELILGSPSGHPGITINRGDGGGGVSRRWDMLVNASNAFQINDNTGGVTPVSIAAGGAISLSGALTVAGAINGAAFRTATANGIVSAGGTLQVLASAATTAAYLCICWTDTAGTPSSHNIALALTNTSGAPTFFTLNSSLHSWSTAGTNIRCVNGEAGNASMFATVIRL